MHLISFNAVLNHSPTVGDAMLDPTAWKPPIRHGKNLCGTIYWNLATPEDNAVPGRTGGYRTNNLQVKWDLKIELVRVWK